MTLENIQQAVLDVAGKEADHVLKAAKAAIEQKVKEQRSAAEHESERRYQAAVRAIDDELARKLIQFKGAAGKQLLEKRNVRLREIFQQAKGEILRWPTDQYAGVMRRHLAEAAGNRGGAVRVHPQDKEVFARLIQDLNRNRSAEAQLCIDHTQSLPEPGGFVFVGLTYEVDRTLSTLLTDLEREMAPEVAADVFAG
ncbi:MAG: hypothetical protein HY706_04505 [Candidatus Hydrogenedentes bacterium]|nr:hypothetical protein [Candidatus Hydrogenedentota bacterium]